MGCPIFLNVCLFHHKPQAGGLHGQESKKTTWADTLDSPGPAHYEEQQMGWGLMVCKNGLPSLKSWESNGTPLPRNNALTDY